MAVSTFSRNLVVTGPHQWGSLPHRPFPSPKERWSNLLFHYPSPFSLPFSRASASSFVFARWDATWFMNHPIKPIMSANLFSWIVLFDSSDITLIHLVHLVSTSFPHYKGIDFPFIINQSWGDILRLCKYSDGIWHRVFKI